MVYVLLIGVAFLVLVFIGTNPRDVRDTSYTEVRPIRYDVSDELASLDGLLSSENKEVVSGLPLDIKKAKSVEIVRRYLQASSALEAQEIMNLSQMSGLDPGAIWAERNLAENCAFTSDSNSAMPKPLNQWAIDAIVKYCEGWNPELMSDDPESLRDKDASQGYTKHTVSKALRETDSKERTNLVSGLINTALTPSELKYAISAVLKLGTDKSEFVNMGQDAAMGPVDYQNTVLAAGIMIGCENFGGCASDSVAFLNYCAISAGCQPHMDLLDLSAIHFSPFQWDQALKIRNFMLSNGDG